jgi:hypothetical protein
MENTLKEYKRKSSIRQEYFAVYGEYANDIKVSLWRIFDQIPKKL